MFNKLVFICPLIFTALAISFPLCINNIFKLKSQSLTLNIGKLNADDIRKLHENQRMYLRTQTIIYLSLAVILTSLLSVISVVGGYSDNISIDFVLCLIQCVVGIACIYPLIKKAKSLKSEIRDL